jgi:hypothetical protein
LFQLLDGLPRHSRKRLALLKSAENLQLAMTQAQLNRHTMKAWLQRSGPKFLIELVADKLRAVDFRGGMLGCEEAAVLVLAYLNDGGR